LESGDRRAEQIQLRKSEERTVDNLLRAILGRIVDESHFTIEGVQLAPAPRDGVLPENFYGTTNHPTRVFFDGEWLPVAHQKMDCSIVIDLDRKVAECRKMAFIKQGEMVVVGNTGVKIEAPQEGPGIKPAFSFMSSSISTERRTYDVIKGVAQEIRGVVGRGGKVVLVGGPAIVHVGAAGALAQIIAKGYVSALLTGNALAVHDIEYALFATALGKDTEAERANHLRAINTIRRLGSINSAVERGILTSGIMYECVRHRVPYLLAGSIRDDGPLPEVVTDVMVAQKKMSEVLEKADLVLMIASMLHSIAAGNLLPSTTRTVCVDINQGTVTKLIDRGTQQAFPVVTDVSLFLHVLNQELPVIAPEVSNGSGEVVVSDKTVLFRKLLLDESSKAVSLLWPGTQTGEIRIATPKQREHGEYCIAVFPLAKQLGSKPPEVALALKTALEKSTVGRYFDMSTVGPYINFKFSSTYMLSEVPGIGPDFGKNHALAGQTALVEWVSANPTGPLHIGHGRWAVLGDSICRLLTACGAMVTREFYVNDAGAQIQRFRDSVQAVREGRPTPEDGYHGSYVAELAKRSEDPVALMMENHRQTLSAMGVNFDVWFSERTLHEQNKVNEAIALLERLGLTYRAKVRAQDKDEPNADADAAEGEALWFRSTQFGDSEDRVLVRADGRPTYFAADVAYHLNKIQRGFGLLVNIFGADHHGYVARLSAAIQALSEKRQEHQIIIGQLVKLLRGGQEVRMSKRTGEMITFDELVEELGADAVRVFMSLTGFNTALNIDLDLAKSASEENPYYYIEYAHARISQIFQKAQEAGLEPALTIPPSYIPCPEEREVLTLLFQFPDLVFESARERNINLVLRHTIELAKAFSAFYTAGKKRAELRVINTEDILTSRIRLSIARATQQVLKNAFDLLGIRPLDRMDREIKEG
jgi:arginyl-tRNA synthetase